MRQQQHSTTCLRGQLPYLILIVSDSKRLLHTVIQLQVLATAYGLFSGHERRGKGRQKALLCSSKESCRHLEGIRQGVILIRRGEKPTEACEGKKLAAELARGPQSASIRVAMQSRCWPGTHARDVPASAACFLRPGLLERCLSLPAIGFDIAI